MHEPKKKKTKRYDMASKILLEDEDVRFFLPRNYVSF